MTTKTEIMIPARHRAVIDFLSSINCSKTKFNSSPEHLLSAAYLSKLTSNCDRLFIVIPYNTIMTINKLVLLIILATRINFKQQSKLSLLPQIQIMNGSVKSMPIRIIEIINIPLVELISPRYIFPSSAISSVEY
jgi:hypothetical protein